MPRNKPLLIEIGSGLSLMMGTQTISSWDTKSRPKSPKAGTIGFNLQTNSIEYWDGKSWYGASMSA